ncbi:MAG: endonuclease/exonuclease/phosphatase family protein [Myxococcaceae bacterium]
MSEPRTLLSRPTWRYTSLAAASLVLVVCVAGRSSYALGTLLALVRWPIVAAAAAVLASFAVQRRTRAVLLGVPVIALAAGEWGLTVWTRARPEKRIERGRHFTVVTFNLLYEGGSTSASAKMLPALDADLLALQEFTPAYERALTPLLAREYPYHASSPRPGATGYGLYSKYPLQNVTLLGPHAWPFAQCFNVVLPEGPLRACNVHFSSPQRALLGGGNLWDGLLRTEGQRTLEWSELVNHLELTARPGEMRLVLGDLNTLESEPLYRTVSRQFVDGYRTLHSDSGATWPSRAGGVHFPVIRIDYVLSSGPLIPLRADVPSESGSDHMAVRATFALPAKGVTRR